MTACSSGSVISGKSIKSSIGRSSRVSQSLSYSASPDLFLGQVRKKVDAEQAQAG